MSERKLLISQKKQITPLSREERFLSAAVGGDYETAPLTAKEQIMKNVVDNGGGGITPTGTINITENGEHDVTEYATANVSIPTPTGTINITSNGEHNVANYATANVSVTSDFGTVEVTIVNGSASHMVDGSLPHTMSLESLDFAYGDIQVVEGETLTLTAITYKGKCLLVVWEDSNFNIVTSGAAESMGEGQYLITGNCTLTVSDKSNQ